jgi:magnesium transporter
MFRTRNGSPSHGQDERVIVDCAAHEGGRRVPGQLDLDQCERWRDEPGAFVWLGLRMPGADEARRVAEVFALHPLAAEDATGAHDLLRSATATGCEQAFCL